MPYLTRVLGVEQFGLLGSTTEILAILFAFTDWGFSLSVVREVARNRRNPVELRRILWDTTAARLMLMFVSLGVVFIVMACVGFASPLATLVLCGWTQILIYALGTGWFLRGLEVMGPMAASELIGRILYIPLIFLFVHGPSDTMLAVLMGVSAASFQASSHFASLIVSLRCCRSRGHCPAPRGKCARGGFWIFVVLFVGAPYLTVIFFGQDFAAATPTVRILSGTVFLSGLTNVLGTQIMLAFGMQRAFMRILVGSGLFNLVAVGPLPISWARREPRSPFF